LNDFGPSILHKLALLTIVLMWIPLAILVIYSFGEGPLLQFPPSGFTLHWYVEFFTDTQSQQAIYNSIVIALVATPIALVVSMLAVIGIDRYDIPGKSLLLVLLISPILLPRIVGAISLFQMSELIGFQGFWLVVAAHVLICLPFSSLVLLETFSSFDRTLESAAKDLGANELVTFFTVTLPNMKNGIIAAGILVFTFSLNEFLLTYFVRDSDMVTLPIYLFTRTVYGAEPVIYALSVVFIITATALVLIAITLTSVSRVART